MDLVRESKCLVGLLTPCCVSERSFAQLVRTMYIFKAKDNDAENSILVLSLLCSWLIILKRERLGVKSMAQWSQLRQNLFI
jgi:hypothetical protein